jgi:hypothetical protein
MAGDFEILVLGTGEDRRNERGQARGAGAGARRMNGSTERVAWQPGQPVATAQDHAEWQAWRRARIREGQRWRRSRVRRTDYYPSEEAAAVIDRLRTRSAGGDASSILNRIIAEWATASGIK